MTTAFTGAYKVTNSETDLCDLISFSPGQFPNCPSVAVTAIRDKIRLSRFAAYRNYAGDASELDLIPTILAGGHYGSRTPEKRTAEPEDTSEPYLRAWNAVTASVIKRLNCFDDTAVPAPTIGVRTEALRLAAVRLAASSQAVQPTSDRWVMRLDNFALLPQGWDSYRAEPPSASTVASAKRFLSFLHSRGKAPDKLNPSVVGGVGFTFRQGTRSVYIEFRNTGNAHAAFVGAAPEPEVVKVNQNGVEYAAVLAKIETHLHEHTAPGHESEWPPSLPTLPPR